MLSPVEIIVEDGSSSSPPPRPPVPAAVIHLVIPRADIQSVMGPAIQEIMATLKAQNIAIAGPMFAHHNLTECKDNFDFEVGFPFTTTTTTTTLSNQGRVKSSTVPFATKTAKVTYTGPYEGLHQAWSDFGDQLAAAGEGRRSSQGTTTMWEVYTVGPETTDDPTQWQTDLVVPIE
jgi:effector-binding domain-containing protein